MRDRWIIMMDEYDPRCSACWLGHGHTESVHIAKIAAEKAAALRYADQLRAAVEIGSLSAEYAKHCWRSSRMSRAGVQGL